MFLFKRTGEKTTEISDSIRFFFLFLGHFFYSFVVKSSQIKWRHTLWGSLRAGSWIVLPLIIVTMLMGISIALSINYILARYNLQNQALFIVQESMIRDIAPFPIGFVLCVHCGLNLIDKNHPSLNQPPETVLLETIIPLIVAMNLTAMLLYTYVSAAFYASVFLAFNYFLHTNTDEYLLKLSRIISPMDITLSIGKTMLLATVASLIAGYYYYDVAMRVLATRKAVSRIITRGLFWLVVISVFIKVFFSN